MKGSDFLSEWMGPIFVASYSWISMLSQLLLHWKIHTSVQSVYMEFKDTLSENKLASIVSSMDCKMNLQTALCCGIIGGLLAAFIVIVISRPIIRKERYPEKLEEFRKYTRKTRILSTITYLASLTYFLILTTIFLLVDQHGFLPIDEVICGVFIAGVIGLSLAVIPSYIRTYYQFRNSCIVKTYWKMVQSSNIQFFNTIVWTFLTILIAFGATIILRFIVQMPPEISYSTQFGTVIVCWIYRALIPILGGCLGILMPAIDRIKLAENKVAELDFKNSNEA